MKLHIDYYVWLFKLGKVPSETCHWCDAQCQTIVLLLLKFPVANKNLGTIAMICVTGPHGALEIDTGPGD